MAEEGKKKGGLKLGAKVWVRDADVANPDVFVRATMKGIAGKMAKVEVESTKAEYETDVFFPANPPGQDFNDHTALVYLSDATLLENSRIRYAKDEIYTFVGPILISVNPFKYIEQLYRPELMSICRKYAPGHPDRPAHTFSMSEAAYQQMVKQKHSQSLVVSGESGAGKTEVNKQCMNYLVWRACDTESDLATRILESNPVLEGLGNAKTVRNNNSSRFGKFVTMRFDDSGANAKAPRLVGAEVQTFLLERSRIVNTTAAGERNYHVRRPPPAAHPPPTHPPPTRRSAVRLARLTPPPAAHCREWRRPTLALALLSSLPPPRARARARRMPWFGSWFGSRGGSIDG
jgi:myosin heavy subunit